MTMWLLQALSSVFANKLVDDNRVPVPLLDNAWGYRIGLLPIENAFHLQVVVLFNVQIVLSLVFGVLLWFGILVPTSRRQKRKDGAQRIPPPPLFSLLLGFGLVIPASLILPFYVFDAMDLRSMALRFGCIFIPMMVPFKCLDAMFGVDSVDRRLRTASFRHYAYYSFPMMPKYAVKKDDELEDSTGDEAGNGGTKKDKQQQQTVVVPFTAKTFRKSFGGFLKWFLISIVYCHIFRPYNFAPFPEQNPDRDPATDIYPTFELSRLGNNYIQFLSFFLTIISGFDGVALYCGLMGRMEIAENPFEKQPLFLASSPSDFGRRWNSLIHHNLKEGVYKPVRAWVGWKHPSSKAAATLATFLASGLLHEYVWALLFFRTTQDQKENPGCDDCFQPVYGKSLVFFGWCCMLLIVEESPFGKWLFVETVAPTLRRYLPAPVFGALLVFLIGCPIVHLFTECLVHGKYFEHFYLAMPILVVEKV